MRSVLRARIGEIYHFGVLQFWRNRRFHRKDNFWQERLGAMNIDPELTIVDCGGHVGEFTQELVNRFPESLIVVYEPVIDLAAGLRKRFTTVPNVAVRQLALSSNDGWGTLTEPGSLAGRIVDSAGEGGIFVELREASAELLSLGKLSLLALNVEGSEYEILSNLSRSGVINKIDNLAIQFHRIKGHRKLKREVCREIEKTHELVYRIEYVWEMWKFRS